MTVKNFSLKFTVQARCAKIYCRYPLPIEMETSNSITKWHSHKVNHHMTMLNLCQFHMTAASCQLLHWFCLLETGLKVSNGDHVSTDCHDSDKYVPVAAHPIHNQEIVDMLQQPEV